MIYRWYEHKGNVISTGQTKFSIITITYDDLEGLKKTIDSVQRQQFSGVIEHIVVDGGSGRDVEEYLAGISLPGFSYVSEPDDGIYDAMNKGMKHATGDVFWWLNSGDCFSNSYSLETAQAFLENPLEQWGYGITKKVSPTGVFDGLIFPFPYNFAVHASGTFGIPHPSAFFGAKIVSRLASYDLDAPIAADQIFMIRAADIVEPVQIPSVLTAFDTSGVSSRQSFWQAYFELRKSLRKYQIQGVPKGWRQGLHVAEALVRGGSNRLRRVLTKIADR